MDVPKDYVLGFMFSKDLTKVALIRKNKPDWQKGKLNAPGGKLKTEESPNEAMVREFEEETGYKTELSNWHLFLTMMGGPDGGKFRIRCFTAIGDVELVSTREEEKIEIVSIPELAWSWFDKEAVENLGWLMYMALDYEQDGQPSNGMVYYQ